MEIVKRLELKIRGDGRFEEDSPYRVCPITRHRSCRKEAVKVLLLFKKL
jgi:glycerate kinase